MKRNIFIAVLPSHDHRQLITQHIHQCEAKRHSGIRIKWTYTSDLHITLGFLPKVEEKAIPVIAQCFQPMTKFTKFMANVKDVRIFGNAIVLRLEPYQTFLNLFKTLKTQLQTVADGQYHFTEHARFEAHLTIGRIKSPHVLGSVQKQQLITMVAEQFVRISFLIQQGALMQRLPDDILKQMKSAQVYDVLKGYTLK